MGSTAGSVFVFVPSSIVIPLPLGLDAKTFFELQAFTFNIAICLSVVFAVLIWDYFVLLPDEIRLYRTIGWRVLSTPPAIAFIVLRYSGIIATFPAIFFTAVPTPYCQAVATLSQAGVALSVASSGLIFSYRVSAIWGRNLFINSIVGIFYVAMLACWITVGSTYHAKQGPPTPFGSNCLVQPIPNWSPISNASSVIFDSIVLILTLLKLNTNRGTQSRVAYLVYRDSLLYFIITATANITVLVIQALPADKYAFYKPEALPFATLMTVSMGVRVYLNLKLFNERENRGDTLPLTQSESQARSRYPHPGIAVVKSVAHYPPLGPPAVNSEVYSGYNLSHKAQDSHIDFTDSEGTWKH
jgi:hypothetical protein